MVAPLDGQSEKRALARARLCPPRSRISARPWRWTRASCRHAPSFPIVSPIVTAGDGVQEWAAIFFDSWGQSDDTTAREYVRECRQNRKQAGRIAYRR